MPFINIEVLDCVIAGGLLVLLISFLLKLVNTQKKNEFEGLQELESKPTQIKDQAEIVGKSDMPINKSQYPKKKIMDPPPSLKNDISKITFLNKKIIKNFLLTSKLNNKTSNQDLLEKEFFIGENYRKIKKSLINEIASARIQELAEVILTKNINLFNYNKKNKTVFLKINDSSNLENFKDSYKFFFSKKNFFNHKFIEKIDTENIVSKASKLIQYGWKKEAVPVISTKKSLIVRLFEAIFG